ncbi:MAG: PKD domain-containing protein [Acidobacteriota bacterium]|nr:PKD domain-containing protein [Acidobacteriota bacterium]MDH3523648.1 PKD domain-containing protein [Acidobacteriota bacterium]
MRHARNIFRLFALAGVLGVVAWGCSTQSPTAPNQVPPPPPGPPGQAYAIALGSNPSGIAVDPDSTGTENTAMVVTVSPAPPNETTILVETNIGQFDPTFPVRAIGLALVNGKAFFTLWAGSPVQRGIATVRATLAGSQGALDVPIDFLFADFNCNNPEMNESVNFINTSSTDATDFFWDFGDGTSSDERSPLHIYDAPGAYSVELTVSKVFAQVVLQASVRKTVDTASPTCGAVTL